jgi:hypothetical protein
VFPGPKIRNIMKTALRIILLVIVLCTVYTIVRYYIFKGVEWTHFPLFILNKILALSGFILLVLSLALDPYYRKRGPEWFEIRKYLGRTGFVLVIMHIIMSFLLFRPEVYDKFFAANGNLNSIGEWSMLLGTLGITAYIIIHNSFSHMDEVNRFHRFIRSSLFGITALSLSALHIAVLGFDGWLTPRDWYGGMPSNSLVAVSIFLIGFIIFFLGQSKQKNSINPIGK